MAQLMIYKSPCDNDDVFTKQCTWLGNRNFLSTKGKLESGSPLCNFTVRPIHRTEGSLETGGGWVGVHGLRLEQVSTCFSFFMFRYLKHNKKKAVKVKINTFFQAKTVFM